MGMHFLVYVAFTLAYLTKPESAHNTVLNVSRAWIWLGIAWALTHFGIGRGLEARGLDPVTSWFVSGSLTVLFSWAAIRLTGWLAWATVAGTRRFIRGWARILGKESPDSGAGSGAG